MPYSLISNNLDCLSSSFCNFKQCQTVILPYSLRQQGEPAGPSGTLCSLRSIFHWDLFDFLMHICNNFLCFICHCFTYFSFPSSIMKWEFFLFSFFQVVRKPEVSFQSSYCQKSCEHRQWTQEGGVSPYSWEGNPFVLFIPSLDWMKSICSKEGNLL